MITQSYRNVTSRRGDVAQTLLVVPARYCTRSSTNNGRGRRTTKNGIRARRRRFASNKYYNMYIRLHHNRYSHYYIIIGVRQSQVSQALYE
jgi:hypothetical protein